MTEISGVTEQVESRPTTSLPAPSTILLYFSRCIARLLNEARALGSRRASIREIGSLARSAYVGGEDRNARPC